MSLLPTIPAADYPLHARALERHAQWAYDFAAVGDLGASLDELRDISALASELRTATIDA